MVVENSCVAYYMRTFFGSFEAALGTVVNRIILLAPIVMRANRRSRPIGFGFILWLVDCTHSPSWFPQFY